MNKKRPFTFNESSPFWKLGRPGSYTARIRGLGNHGHFSPWSGSAWCITENLPGAEPIYFPAKVSRTTADSFGQRGYVMAAQGVPECLYPGSAVEIFSPSQNVADQLNRLATAHANASQWNEIYKALDRHGFHVSAHHEKTVANPEIYGTLDRMIREEAERLLAAAQQE